MHTVELINIFKDKKTQPKEANHEIAMQTILWKLRKQLRQEISHSQSLKWKEKIKHQKGSKIKVLFSVT